MPRLGRVDRLPSGFYRARITVAGHRLSSTHPSRELAEDWLLEMFTERVHGRSRERVTVAEAADDLIEYRGTPASRPYTRSTMDDFRSLVSRVTADWSTVDVSSITPAAINDWASRLKYSPSTVRNRLNCLASILRHAERRGWINRAPRVERPTVTSNCRQLSSLPDLEQAQPDCRLILLLAYDAGLRRGEICLVDREHVRRGWLEVCGKGGVMRWVPVLTARLAVALEGPWFTCRSPKGIDWLVRHTYGSVSLHGLRHSWISTLADMGVPPHQLAAWAGHSVTVSMRYYHPATPFGSRAAETPDLTRLGTGLQNRSRGRSHRSRVGSIPTRFRQPDG
jgi:integrase